MSSEKNIVTEKLLELLDLQNLYMYGKKLSSEDYNIKRNGITKVLAGAENYYISTLVDDGEVKKIVIAFRKNDPFEGDIVNIRDMYFDNEILNRDNVLAELELIKEKFPSNNSNNVKLKATFLSNDHKLLDIFSTLNFKYYTDALVGNASYGLKYLNQFINQKKSTFSKFEITNMDFEEDIDEVIRVDSEASNSCESCLMKLDTQIQVNEMTKYYKLMCNEGTCWKLTVDDKIIGVTGFLKHDYCLDGYLIGALAIDPEYQGIGLSKLLFHKNLTEIQKRNVNLYVLGTSTNQVLSVCKRIKCEVKKKVLYQSF